MRINRVRLKNYRTHRDITLEFERGMNLLLGANGAGKSSILEAIGITLFDSKYRDGTSKGQKQVIRYGEKQALVEIEFTANDGEIYIIENQLKTSGTGYTRLYRIDERDEMLTVSSEIKEKLRTLVGIERGLTDIYDNIIVAKQNEFINLYKLKPKDRKDAFNAIFETEIYEEMSGEYGKKVEDEYKNQIKKVEGEIGTLGEHLEDRDVLVVQMQETLTKKQHIYGEEKSQKEIRDQILKELTDIEEIKNEIGLLKNSFTSQKDFLLKVEEELESNGSEIEVSKKSQNIVKEKEGEYLEYEKLLLQEGEQRKRTHELELKNDKFLALERELERSERRVGEISGKIERSQADAKGQLNMQAIFMKKEEDFQRELFEKETSAREIEQNLLRIEPLMDILLKLKRQEENHLLEERDLKLKEENLLKGVKEKEIVVIDLSLETLENRVVELEKKVLEKDEIKNRISNMKTLLESNREAKESLAGARCPFLKERCKNLENMDIETYFLDKEREYSEILNKNSERLDIIEKEVKLLDAIKGKIFHGKNLEAEIEKDRMSLEHIETKRENVSLKIGAVQSEIEKVSLEHGDLETLQEKRSSWRAQYETLNVETLKGEILKVRRDIESITKQMEDLNRDIVSLEEEKRDNLERGKHIQKDLETLREDSLKFQKEKENLKTLHQEMEKLREGHGLYNKNMASSKMLEKFLEKEKRLLREREELIEKGRELSQRIEKKIASLPSVEKMEEMEKRRDESQERIESLVREAGILEGKEREFLARIQKVDEGFGKMKEIIAFKTRLEKKKELVEIFRENLRKMGNRVAENIIKEISFYATTNFRKITGRGESIEWSNFDSEGKESPYSVTLKGGDTHITFEQLSGGEQVAVAIAIRGAMNHLFTKAGFAIFDEPTNNLDIERRKSLADNIGEILKDLDQSIIVTHDDTFREMAQKVIEL